ncbi:MAG: DUF3168 domain-containing protein [Pikeienuella sp.]
MPAPANELQAAVFSILTSDAGLTALVGGRVYDRVPMDGDQAPYITFGPSDEVSDDAECMIADDHTLQIDIWSEYQGGFKEAKEIAFAVKQALHGVDIDLPTHALIEIRADNRRYLRDPDGVTSHGIVTVEAMIEER